MRSRTGRRSFIGLAGGALLLAACGSGQPTAAPPSGNAASSSGSPAPAKPADAAKPPDATKPAAGAAATPAAAAPAKAAGGPTLQYWSFFPTDNSRWADRPAMLAEFEQKSGARVEVNFVQDAQLDTKVQTGFAAKQLPDLIDPGIARGTIGWGRQGIALDLNDLLGRLGKDDFAKPLVTALTYKGKLYGLPWQANPQLMFYRKDWLADKALKLGSWDDWLAASKALTGKNPAGKDGYGTGGFMAPVHQEQFVQDFIGPNGGYTFDEKWNVVLDTQKADLEAMEFLKRLAATFQPGAANNNYGDTNNLFTDEVLAINMSSTTFVNGVIRTKPELNDKIGIQPVPAGPSGKGDRGAYLGCYSWVVCAPSAQKELAKDFVAWIMDPPNYIRVFKTIDFGHIPVRISVANDPKLAQLVPPLAIDTIKAGIKAAEIATLAGQDWGPNPVGRQITAQNIWSSLAQKVAADQPAAAIKWAADEIRKIVKDNPDDVG